MEQARREREREGLLNLVNSVVAIVGSYLISIAAFQGTNAAVSVAVILTPATILGGVTVGTLGLRRVRSAIAYGALVIAAGAVVGACFGALLGATMMLRPGDFWSADAVVFVGFLGTVAGTVYALAFMPSLVALFVAVRRVGRARRGTPVDRADRALPWLVVALSMVAGALLGGVVVWHIRSCALAGLAVVGTGLSLWASGVVVRAWRGLCRVRTRLEGLTLRDGEALESLDGAALDCGVGAGFVEAITPAALPYRDHERVVQRLRGDHDQARRALGRLVALSLSLSLVAIAGTACVVWLT